MTCRFRVDGKVVGKARPRVTLRGGFARAYTPKKTKEAEERIRAAFLEAGGMKHKGAVVVYIEVYRTLPKSTPKKIVSADDIVKPDVDNIAKVVLDALDGLAYDDDSQVVGLNVRKHPRTHESERMYVTILPQRSND